MTISAVLLILILAADAPAPAGQQPGNPSESAVAPAETVPTAQAAKAEKAKKRYADLISAANLRVIELTAEIASLPQPPAELFHERADCYMDLGLPEKAVDDYTQALARDTRTNVLAYHNRIWAYVRCGRYQQAIDDAEALVVRQRSVHHVALWALLLAKSPNRPKEDRADSLMLAKEAYRASKEGKFSTELTERALAAAYSVNGDFESAVKHQKKAIKAMGEHVALYAREELAAYEAGKECPYPAKEVREPNPQK